MSASDELKKFFAQNGGGGEKDWKRLPNKHKNEEGQWVREFLNKKTGVHLEVVEIGPGQFKARRLTGEANASFAQPSEPARAPVIDNDPAHIAAADKIIEKLLDRDSEEDAEFSQAQLNKAGRALANRFTFAIGGIPGNDGLDDGLFAEISPCRGDYDQHIEHVISHLLPPNGGEVMELNFDFSNYKDVVKLASDLMARGFVWDKDYQASMDSGFGCNHLPTLEAAFKQPPAAPSTGAPPKPPKA